MRPRNYQSNTGETPKTEKHNSMFNNKIIGSPLNRSIIHWHFGSYPHKPSSTK